MIFFCIFLGLLYLFLLAAVICIIHSAAKADRTIEEFIKQNKK